MSHSAVVRGSEFVHSAVRYLQKDSIPLVLGEVGSALDNGSDFSSVDNVFGSALWQVDFYLYSMSIVSNFNQPLFPSASASSPLFAPPSIIGGN